MNLKELKEKEEKYIIPTSHTNGRRYKEVIPDDYPVCIRSADGVYVTGQDHKQYLDWTASYGSVLLGYEQNSYSQFNLPLPHESEILLAEKLVEMIPCAEKVRFFKNGSDACTAAVMVAREINNYIVISTGYHGWHEWIDDTIKVEYGDLETLENEFRAGGISCFILEPMTREFPEKCTKKYLQEVRELCTKYNVILIFDEIITGFRYRAAGIQEMYGVIPDLACYGKAMGNGHSISALVGKKEIMERMKDLTIRGTYFSEVHSFQSALQVIEAIETQGVISHIWYVGESLRTGIEMLLYSTNIDENIAYIKGFGPWNALVWGDKEKEVGFYRYITKNNILYIRDHFAMFAHTQDDVARTLEVYEKGFKEVLR